MQREVNELSEYLKASAEQLKGDTAALQKTIQNSLNENASAIRKARNKVAKSRLDPINEQVKEGIDLKRQLNRFLNANDFCSKA